MKLNILASTELVNEQQKTVLFDKIERHFEGALEGKRFAIWGLAFKPNTDDMREATSRKLIGELLRRGATVSVYDPVALEEARRRLSEDLDPDAFEMVHFSKDRDAALRNAEALVILTEWKEFRSPDFEQMKSVLNDTVIFDGRNLYDPLVMQNDGWTYYTIGRDAVRTAA